MALSVTTPVRSAAVGHCLLLWLGEFAEPRTVNLARSIVNDPDHTVVVLDVPCNAPVELWHAVARELSRYKGSFRLVWRGQSREANVMTGQWLAERLGRIVLAADGEPVLAQRGGLFVPPHQGIGWVRYQRGKAAKVDSRHFPKPDWAGDVVDRVWAIGPTSFAEPMPGGVWLHPERVPSSWRHALADSLCGQSDQLVVALGYPGGPALSVADIAMFWSALPCDVRPMVRFLPYGPVAARGALGPALADLLGHPVALYGGMPTAWSGIRAIGQDGSLGWQLYAEQIGHWPENTAQQQVIAHRAPLLNARQVAQGVYWFALDTVVEVIPSGLWLRPSTPPADCATVRSVPVDAAHPNVVFDSTASTSALSMESLARELVGQLEPAVRERCRVLPASAVARLLRGGPVIELSPVTTKTEPRGHLDDEPPTVVISRPAAQESHRTDVVAPAEPEIVELEAVQPTHEAVLSPSLGIRMRLESGEPNLATLAAGPAGLSSVSAPEHFVAQSKIEPNGGPKAESGPVPEPAESEAVEPLRRPDTAMAQPVPAADSSAVPPKRGLDKERAWLRKSLSEQFHAAASSVSRLLSEMPGLRTGTESEAVLADLVAVRIYLTTGCLRIEDAVREAKPGPHVPLARCASAGLLRLPSYRGAVRVHLPAAAVRLEWFGQRPMVTDWTFLRAQTVGGPMPAEHVEFRIWSMTARRTALLDPAQVDQVVFGPGTSYKVLAVSTEPRPLVLLRELAREEIDAQGRVSTERTSLDDVALVGLERAGVEWAAIDHAPAYIPPNAAPGLLPAERTTR